MMIWRGIFAVLMLTVAIASAHGGGGAAAPPAAQLAAR
jgi:hypothetical protein